MPGEQCAGDLMSADPALHALALHLQLGDPGKVA